MAHKTLIFGKFSQDKNSTKYLNVKLANTFTLIGKSFLIIKVKLNQARKNKGNV